jgi:hypothetical protein
MTLAGCDADVQPREILTDPGVTPTSEENGVLLNSFRLNSFRLNSFRLNSFRLNGDPGTDDYIEIAEIDLPGHASAKYSWVEGSNLHIKSTWGQVLDGSELEGAVFAFEVQEDGVKLRREVRISDVSLLKKGSDVLLYDLEIREESDDDKPHWTQWGKKSWWWGHDDDDFGAWEPLCVDSDGDAVPAVLLTDIWDPDTGAKVSPRPTGAVTFACVDAALGKCATWGYRPWATVKKEPLADYHQACTRMVRADYCGDGTSHTNEGTPIHVLDEIGIELLDVDVDFAVEAEWAPDGAVCLNPANTRLPDPDLACALPTCGAGDFSSGGLIQSGTLLDWP